MTSELNPSVRILEYMIGGPKNYSYRVMDTETGRTKTVCKVRGITLNYNTLQTVNFDVMKGMILGMVEERVNVHTEKKIERTRTGGGNGIDSHRARI
jgi:ABC-type sugar transport system ATPase subunit